MNLTSLAHSHVQKQQQSSWIDDPFDIGTYVDKGLTSMSNERILSNYAEELVGLYAKVSNNQYELSLDMLPEESQNELARLYIESIDREIEWACYGADESINSEFLCAMLAMLKDDNEITRARFAHVTRNNILIYYKKTLNELLEKACDDFHHLQANDENYYPRCDEDHDDVIWSKF